VLITGSIVGPRHRPRTAPDYRLEPLGELALEFVE
jgi:hypothetical protein